MTPSEAAARRLRREHAALAFNAGDVLQRQYERVADAARRLLAAEPAAADRARRVLQAELDNLDEAAAAYVGCAELGLQDSFRDAARAGRRLTLIPWSPHDHPDPSS